MCDIKIVARVTPNTAEGTNLRKHSARPGSRLALGVTAGTLLLVFAAGSAAARPALGTQQYQDGPRTDEEQDCDEFVPAEGSLEGVTDDGRMISVSVLTILDDVPLAVGQEAMTTAAGAYREWNIDLQVSYSETSFATEDAPEEMDDGRPAISTETLLAASKAWVGGTRPDGIDVVYTITSKYLTDAAGFADCIGGVRWADRAFAVGEVAEELNLGLNFYVDGTGKIAAHEIGHLLGAHHHYANCVEGASTDIVRDLNPAPCTVMFNYSDFQSAHFGTLEATVIRGHVLAFAGK